MDTMLRRRLAGRLTTATATAAAAVTLALAGCGGSSTSSSSTGGASGSGGANSAQSATSGQLERFAQCMRSHGEPNFPDPDAQGHFTLPATISMSSPQFQAADQACKSLAPAGALGGQAPTPQQLSQALKFVACMRSRGVNLPDPTPQGSFANKLAAAGINPNTPQFKSALLGCRALLPAGNGFGSGS
jgi:hypothetical protein